jgi:hypothetical protein
LVGVSKEQAIFVDDWSDSSAEVGPGDAASALRVDEDSGDSDIEEVGASQAANAFLGNEVGSSQAAAALRQIQFDDGDWDDSEEEIGADMAAAAFGVSDLHVPGPYTSASFSQFNDEWLGSD